MMTGSFPVERLNRLETPFYYYDMDVLRQTLDVLCKEAAEPNWHVHYAVKACGNITALSLHNTLL